jgi:hypothetical protein
VHVQQSHAVRAFSQFLLPSPTPFALCLLQGLLSKAYKGLLVQAKQLGIALLDVRSSISLAALTPAELDATVSGAVAHALQQSGWRCLGSGGLIVRNDFTSAPPGAPVAAAAARISCSAQLPRAVLVTVRAAGTGQVWPGPLTEGAIIAPAAGLQLSFC